MEEMKRYLRLDVNRKRLHSTIRREIFVRSHPQHVWIFQGTEFSGPPRDHALNLEEIRVNKSTDELRGSVKIRTSRKLIAT